MRIQTCLALIVLSFITEETQASASRQSLVKRPSCLCTYGQQRRRSEIRSPVKVRGNSNLDRKWQVNKRQPGSASNWGSPFGWDRFRETGSDWETVSGSEEVSDSEEASSDSETIASNMRVEDMRRLLSRLSEGSEMVVSAKYAAAVVSSLVEAFHIDLLSTEGKDKYYKVLQFLQSGELRQVVARMSRLASAPPVQDEIEMWRDFFSDLASDRPIRQLLVNQILELCAVASFGKNVLSNESAAIAVRALEEALELDGRTWGGYSLLWNVLERLVSRAAGLAHKELAGRDPGLNGKRAEGLWKVAIDTGKETAATGSELATWFMLIRNAWAFDHFDLWKRVFKEHVVDAVLEEIAIFELESTIAVVRKGQAESSRSEQNQRVRSEQNQPMRLDSESHTSSDELRAAFYALMPRFGLWPTGYRVDHLRRADGRNRFDTILDMLTSDPHLRLQVRALGLVSVRGLQDYRRAWDGIVFAPQFDHLRAYGYTKDVPSEFRSEVLSRTCSNLDRVQSSTLRKLISDCVRDLTTLTIGVTNGMKLKLPVSLEEARYVLSALLEAFLDSSYTSVVRAGGYTGLYDKVFKILRKAELRTRVLRIRSLPFTIWFEEWLAFFLSDAFSDARKGIEETSTKGIPGKVTRQRHPAGQQTSSPDVAAPATAGKRKGPTRRILEGVTRARLSQIEETDGTETNIVGV